MGTRSTVGASNSPIHLQGHNLKGLVGLVPEEVRCGLGSPYNM